MKPHVTPLGVYSILVEPVELPKLGEKTLKKDFLLNVNIMLYVVLVFFG